MLKNIKKKILIALAAAGILYLGFSLYANIENLAAAFESFNWIIFPLLLLLSMLNYISRFFKWDYYLKVVNVSLKKLDSFSIFMSGLIMSVTPGKVGELLKAYLVKDITAVPVSKTAPIILAERITDTVSLILITLAGAYVFNYGRTVVIIMGLLFFALLIILGNKKIALPLLSQLEKINFLRKHLESIHNAYESSYRLLRPRPLFYMILLSLVSWSFECLGYYIILVNLNIEVSFLWAAFGYGFATIIGAISMLPGGLGATEGSLTFLIIQKGYSKDLAVASTFLIRVVTLWFAVLVGVVSVTAYQNRFGKITVETVSN